MEPMKRIKLLILTLSLLFSLQKGFSQTLETHRGEMSGGKESYTYYVDTETSESIRHGSYSYIKDEENTDEGSSSLSIKGSYEKGYKNGAWKYTFKQEDVQNGSANIYNTGTISMTLTYFNGMPNGIWEYKYSGKYRKRNYSMLGWSWGNYVTADPQNISVNFKNGVMVGKVLYKTPWVDVAGQLNEKGLFIGNWKVDKTGQRIYFENGIAIHDPKNTKLTALQKKCAKLPYDEREQFCRDNSISYELIPSSNFFDMNDGYFDNGMWLHRKISGDKTYTSDDYGNFNDSREYGKYYYLATAKYRSLESIDSYWYNRNPEELDNLLEENSKSLSNNDINRVRKHIEFTKVNKKNFEKLKPEFKSLVDKYNELVDISLKQYYGYKEQMNSVEEIASKLWQRDIRFFQKELVEQIQNKITTDSINIKIEAIHKSTDYSYNYDYKKVLNILHSIKPSIDSLLIIKAGIQELSGNLVNYLNSFTTMHFEPSIWEIAQKNYWEYFKKLKATPEISSKVLISEDMIKTLKILILVDNTLARTQIRTLKEIASSYHSGQPIERTETIKGHKGLLKEYNMISVELIKRLSEKYSYEELKLLGDITNRFKSLIGTNTKALEKSLKNEASIEGKIKILLGS